MLWSRNTYLRNPAKHYTLDKVITFFCKKKDVWSNSYNIKFTILKFSDF